MVLRCLLNYLAMNRNGTTILTGTVLASMLVSPLTRAPQSESGRAPSGTEISQTKKSPTGKGAEHCSTAACREQIHKQIQQEAQEEYRDDLKEIVNEVCAARNERVLVPTNNPPSSGQTKQQPHCPRPGNFIIALAPDPLHTHLALLFDRTVDALEEAVQDEGYNFDRALMPWDLKVHPESDDYESRVEAEWYREGREDEPGLIAFRRTGTDEDHSQPLFVLLVAETPTAGVHEKQFANAIKFLREQTGGLDLSSPASWGCPDPSAGSNPDVCRRRPALRIVGPTFSGSLHSLSSLLLCGAPKSAPCYPLVSIHSGSVSSRGSIASFQDAAQLYNSSSRGIYFVSLHESDEVMEERFLEFLTGTSYESARPFGPTKRVKALLFGPKEFGGPDYNSRSSRAYAAKDIAILSEDETAYGSSGIPNPKQEYCDTSVAIRDSQCLLKLYFPREISQLRAAYQDTLAVSAAPNGQSPARETLPSNFSVSGSNDDTVTSYSAKQMPLSQESVLLDLVSELHRHSIKFIILRATDPMDTLFLSQFLRSAYPMGRIVTVEADLLFRHEASDPRLHGLLSLATYSPAPVANHYFATYENAHIERVFPSSADAGTYNATRSILTAWVNRASYDSPDCTRLSRCRPLLSNADGSKGPSLFQYGWFWERFGDPAFSSKPSEDTSYNAPPVRLLALGRDDYWPLANLGPYPGEEFLTMLPRVPNQMQGSELRPFPVPSSWRVVQLVGILLACFFSGCVWRASLFARTQAVAKYAPASTDGRLTAILVSGLTQMLILLILLWPSVKNEEGNSLLNVLLVLATGLVFACTTVDLVNRTCLASPKEPWRRRKGWISVIIFVIFTGVFLYSVYLHQPFESKAYTVRFSSLRTMHLTSGLSFIMPTFFFLTVWLWWADHSIAGHALLDKRRTRLPMQLSDPAVQGISEQAPGLQHSLQSSPMSRLWYVAVLAAVFFFSWLMGDHEHPFMTLENHFLSGAMWFFFTLALGGIIVTTLRLWTVWAGVRKLLVALDSLPLRNGFKAIKGFSWDPIWRYGAGNQEDFQRMFNREKEALDCAMNTFPLKAPNLRKDWEDTRDLVPRAREPQLQSASQEEAALLKPTEVSYEKTNTSRLQGGSSQALSWLCVPINKVAEFFECWWGRREAERTLIVQFSKFQEDVADVTGKALDLLSQNWAQKKEEPKRSFRYPALESDRDFSLRAWEHCVCMVYVNFLLGMLVRIRTLIMAIGGMFVLLILGVTQYPFEPKSYIQVLLIGLLAFIIIVVGLVFAQVHRDATLSNLTDTKPGDLGADFWLRMISFTTLPLLTLLASQFPSINRFFYSWVQPALQALTR